MARGGIGDGEQLAPQVRRADGGTPAAPAERGTRTRPPLPVALRSRVLSMAILSPIHALCFVAIKTGLPYAPPLLYGGLRALGQPLWPARRAWGGGLALALAATTLGFGAMFLSPGRTGAGIAAVLGNTQPLLTIILAALFLGERVTRRKATALALGLAGVALIAYPALAGSGSRGSAGPALALAAAFGATAGTVIAKRMDLGPQLLTIAAWQLLLGGLPLLATSAVVERGTRVTWSATFVALLLFLALVGIAFANAYWYWLLRHHEVGELTLFLFLVPLLGLGLAALFFGVNPCNRLFRSFRAPRGTILYVGCEWGQSKQGERGTMYSLDGVRVEQVAIAGEVVLVDAVPTAAAGHCPACGQSSARVHSRYVRVLRDLPCCGRRVRVRLTVRRFRCGTPACDRRTFVEQVPGVTGPHRQAVQRLETLLGAFAGALGGQAGARLAGQAGMPVSGATLLRVLARDEPASRPTPRVLGVDDWAWRRGQRFGTLLVDLEARRPVDLLPDRTSAGLAHWLRAHPGIAVVARDRSPEYARGVAEGAPTAVQVLDRWHLHRNVREVAERVLERHPAQLRAVGDVPPGDTVPPPPRRSRREEARRAGGCQRAAERYATVRQLAAAGLSQRAIAHRLGLARGTVRRYGYAATVPERAANARRPSMLDAYTAYLTQRWAEGCHNGLQLWRELRERGYPGSRKQVALWARARRTEPAPTTPHRHRPAPGGTPAAPTQGRRRPSARRLAWLLVREPERLRPSEQQRLARLQAACPDATVAYPLIQQFVRMLRQSNAEPLEAWLKATEASGVPDLQTFATGLREESAALEAALRLPWSTGPVEGQITRLKLIKRQAYGRAGIDMLRRRMLRAA